MADLPCSRRLRPMVLRILIPTPQMQGVLERGCGDNRPIVLWARPVSRWQRISLKRTGRLARLLHDYSKRGFRSRLSREPGYFGTA
jgi:hypothetical protein